MAEEFAFAIHKKLGCIKKIPIHAIGWINRFEWVVYEKFPTEEIYFNEFTFNEREKKEMRIGIFTLPFYMIHEKLEEIEELFLLMKCVPVEAKRNYDQIEYLAFSKIFPDIGEGNLIPFYMLECRKEEGKLVGVEALFQGYDYSSVLKKEKR
jgi:hypothetical protein